STFIFSKRKWMRQLMLAIFFSRFGEVFTAVKMRYKAFKAARRLRKQAKKRQKQDPALDTQ
ncbi:MAG: hypothetical protein F6K26_29940, partial [Moorea sp. SIO2I5]|nr:hypothetical protein [Moorena sp. SIO2I5]